MTSRLLQSRKVLATALVVLLISGVVVLMISLPKSKVPICSVDPNAFVVMMTGPGMPVPDRLNTS